MATVTLNPGDNIQNAINANPTGTIFSLTDGTYRGASFTPKDSNQFVGSPNAILNGSALLTGTWTQSSGLYSLGGLPTALSTSGQADSSTPMATHPQDLFVNDALYQRVASKSLLGPGKWYFDESNRVAYTADNLNGQTVEISSNQTAINGTAQGVTVSGITVEKYASAASYGAININGDNWTLQNVTGTHNHGAAVDVFGNNAQIQGGRLVSNGQEGFDTWQSNGLIVNGVEIAGNNYAGFDKDWEAGGFKVGDASNVALTNNNVHDNNGVGMWDDANNYLVTISGNTVTNNAYNGIMSEISYDTSIHDNTISGNGLGYSGQTLIPAQIVLQNAQNTNVYNNNIEIPASHGNGIALTYDSSRGSGTRGAYNTTGNTIHNNTEVFDGSGGSDGIVSYQGSTGGFSNTWTNNAFAVTSAGHQVFDSLGSYMTLAQAQSSGFEQGSTETISGQPPPPPPPPPPIDDTLVLDLSEDAYKGNAQFKVKLDGSVIAGPLSVTALHPTQHQTFTFDLGSLVNGNHSISVDFTNDLYGGTRATDRNLYINSASVNSTHIGGPVTMLSSGWTTFPFADNNHQITA